MERVVSNTEEPEILLRDVAMSDLPIFFDHQQDADANRMAAFTSEDPTDRDAFMAHWTRIVEDETITIQTILCEGQVVGHVLGYKGEFGLSEVGYWIDKAYWGQGIASQALAAFLVQFGERPVYARAVKDNTGSLRVLEKCGFVFMGEGKGFANARGEEVEEIILRLD
jgi:RimJ/RimL family protein N-acetyltransferase